MNEAIYRLQIERTMKPMEPDRKLAMLGLGVSCEASEVADVLKKIIFQGHEFNKEELVKELGDLEWYVTHLKETLDISSDYVRLKNIEKLKERYPQGFFEKDSINRKEGKS